MDPRDDSGVIGEAWAHGRAGVEGGSVEGDRVTVTAPIKDTRGRQIGIVVHDSIPGSLKPDELLDATRTVVRQRQGLVAVALAFGGLRERASIEERERLARQTHDGVAQELVALGFRVDRLKRLPNDQLPSEIASCASRSAEFLPTSVPTSATCGHRSARGWARRRDQLPAPGVQSLDRGGRHFSVVRVVVPPAGPRGDRALPHPLDFLADARRDADLAEVEVFLKSQAPDAEIILRQSGPTRLTEAELFQRLPASLGAMVSVIETDAGSEITVHLTAVPEAPAMLDERLPQPF